MGKQILVNTTTAGNQTDAAVTGLANGRFVVTWTDDSHVGSDTSGTAIRGQIYNADGSKAGSEFQVNTDQSGLLSQQKVPQVTALSDGRFVVAWEDSSDFGGDCSGAVQRKCSRPTARRRSAILLDTPHRRAISAIPSFAVLADGRFVVAWEDGSNSQGGDISGTAVLARIFNPDG